MVAYIRHYDENTMCQPRAWPQFEKSKKGAIYHWSQYVWTAVMYSRLTFFKRHRCRYPYADRKNQSLCSCSLGLEDLEYFESRLDTRTIYVANPHICIGLQHIAIEADLQNTWSCGKARNVNPGSKRSIVELSWDMHHWLDS